MKVVTILGPSQSGKTTLAAALAGLEGGRPLRLQMFGDAAVTRFSFLAEDWAVIDCPGGAEHMAQAGLALAASDAAVLCLPAEAEAAVLAAPWLRLAEAAGLPTLIFVNRLDQMTDRVADIVAALQAYCAHGIVLRQIPLRREGAVVGAVDLISERAWEYRAGERSTLVALPDALRAREEAARADLLEHLADFDDHLLEEIIEDQAPLRAEVYEVATKALQRHDLVPALLGAAAHGNGVMRLMKSLRHEVPEVTALAARLGTREAAAICCLADSVKHLGKTVLLRALTPVAAGQPLAGANLGALLDLDGKTPLGPLAPGDLGLAVKSDQLGLAQPLCTGSRALPAPGWARAQAPNHRATLSPVNTRDEARLATALTRLAEIDPGMALSPDARSGKTVAATQGPQHLRRIEAKLAEVFGLEVTTAPVPPALYETPARATATQHRHRKQSGGAGQFADVSLEVRPQARGTGFAFDERIKGGAVPRNYIPAVEAGAREALAEGPQGHPVIDVVVTLTDGKHHAVDSSDFAFRAAGRAATRAALAETGTTLLQPIDRLRVEVPNVFSGGLVALITGLKGQVLGFEADPAAAGWDIFNVLLPEATLDELFTALGAATRGTARYTAEPDHYEETHP